MVMTLEEAVEVLQKSLESNQVKYMLIASPDLGPRLSALISKGVIQVTTSPFDLKKEIIELAKQVKEKAKHESANEESAEQ